MDKSPTKEDLGRFLAIAAHELRTPLTSLKASLQILERRLAGADGKDLELLGVARRNSERLDLLVDDLVDFMKLSMGEIALNEEPLEPVEFLAKVRDAAEKRTDRSDIRILGAPGTAPPIMGDPARLQTVLIHLVQNAAHASEPGSGIELSASPNGDGILLQVTDHGGGVGEQDRERIFEPFLQLDSSDTRGIPGLGLGLAICKEIVDLHRGRIWAEGEKGHGLTMNILLPVSDAGA